MTDEPKPGGLVAELKSKAQEPWRFAYVTARETAATAWYAAAEIAEPYEARWQAREARLRALVAELRNLTPIPENVPDVTGAVSVRCADMLEKILDS